MAADEHVQFQVCYFSKQINGEENEGKILLKKITKMIVNLFVYLVCKSMPEEI